MPSPGHINKRTSRFALVCLVLMAVAQGFAAQRSSQPSPKVFVLPGAALCVATHPSGLVATGGLDSTIRLWDTTTGKEKRILYGHESRVTALAFVADGRRLASASWDGTARIWDVATGKEVFRSESLKASLYGMDITPDGRRLVVVGDDRLIRVLDTTTRKTLQILSGHQGTVTSVAFSTDAQKFVTTSNDTTVRVWRASNGFELLKIQGHSGATHAAEFSGDGTQIVSASADGTARIWNAQNGKELLRLVGHTSTVLAVHFSPDQKKLLTSSADGTLRFWDQQTGKALGVIQAHSAWAYGTAFVNDNRIVSVGLDGQVRTWNNDGRMIAEYAGHASAISSVSLSNDGQLMVYGTSDGHFRVIDTDAGKQLVAQFAHVGWVNGVAMSADGERVATAGDDNTVRVWNTKGGAALQEFKGHEKFVNSVRWNTEGNRLVSASDDGTARLWQVGNNTELQIFANNATRVRNATFSPDGRRVATAAWDGTARIWDVRTGAELQRINLNDTLINDVAFSSDGKRLAIVGSTNNNVIWDLGQNKALTQLVGANANTSAVAFDVKGKKLYTAGADRVIFVWDATNGKRLDVIGDPDQSSAIAALAISSNEQVVAAATRDGLRVWRFLDAQLAVQTNAPNAQISIDNQSPQALPTEGWRVQYPAGRIVVTVSAPGYKTISKTIELQPGQTTTLNIPLEPNTVALRVTANATATVFVNNEPQGQTTALGLVIQVPAGREVTVRLSVPNQPDQEQRLTPNSDQTLNFTFQNKASNTPPTAPPRTGVYALVVGIQNYTDARIPMVRYGESDAKKFADALVNPSIGNLSKSNVQLLLGQQATQNAIQRIFKRQREQLKRGETLIVYFSGHGAPSTVPPNEPLLIPVDADPEDLADSSVRLGSLTTPSPTGTETILILDACFSGQNSVRGIAQLNTRPIGVRSTVSANNGVTVLSATNDKGISLESPELGGGVFTAYLLEGMAGKADSNQDGRVTLQEAYAYAAPKIQTQARAANQTQSPQLVGPSRFAIAANAEKQNEARTEARIERLAQLLKEQKITAQQFEKLVDMVNSNTEDPTLRDFLEGRISEGTFLAALRGGAIPGVPR